MNTIQLQQILTRDKFTREKFIGVFPSDQLPTEIPYYPCCFIVNIDPSNQPGIHWVAFYITSSSYIEFFDSYGNAPSYYEGFISNFALNFMNIVYNPMILQSNISAVCGHYCIYFLYSRCRGRSLRTILSSFVSKNICNDKRVYDFVWKRFHVKVNFFQ